MKITAADTTIEMKQYADPRALIDDYTQSENAQGRSVPAFAWESLVAAVGLWLLKKAADELWKIWIEKLKTKEREISTTGDLDERLMQIEEVAERENTTVTIELDSAGEKIVETTIAEYTKKTGALQSGFVRSQLLGEKLWQLI